MEKKITAVDIYFELEKILNEIKGKHGLDDIFYRAVRKLLKIPKKEIMDEYEKYKENGYNVEVLLKNILEIANINYEDVKAIVDIRKSPGEPISPKEEFNKRIRVPKKVKPTEKASPSKEVLPKKQSHESTQENTPKIQETEQPKSEKKKVKLINIDSKILKTDEQRDKFIIVLCMGDMELAKELSLGNKTSCLAGTTLNEVSIDNVPVNTIVNRPGYQELLEVVNALKSRIKVLIETCKLNQTMYSKDTERVLTWILGEDTSIKELNKKSDEIISYIGVMNRQKISPLRYFTQVRLKFFEDEKKDYSTMVFLMERLKKSSYCIVPNSNEYNGFKISVKNKIKRIINISNTKNIENIRE